MTFNKKLHGVWLTEQTWSKLQKKAREYFQGKGTMERFFEKIADETILFINSKNPEHLIIKFEVEKK